MRAVCFDLDDTLFDYHQYVRGGLLAAAAALEARTGRDYGEELLSLYFEEGVTDATFDRLLSRHDLSPSLVPELVEAYHESPTEMRLTPHPDARPTLDRLADDYALGVVTDGRNGRAKLDVLGLDAYFETVVVTPEHDLSKRDERAFRLALDDLDVEPTRTAYVGDNPATDFREPNRLGMRTIRIRRGRYRDRTPEDGARPDDVIDSLDRLPTLLEPNPHP